MKFHCPFFKPFFKKVYTKWSGFLTVREEDIDVLFHQASNNGEHDLPQREKNQFILSKVWRGFDSGAVCAELFLLGVCLLELSYFPD